MFRRVLALLTLLAASADGQIFLPEGKGKELLDNYCGECHGMDPVMGLSQSAAQWRKTIWRMMAKGASLKPGEVDTLVDYLSTYFGPEDSKETNGKGEDMRTALLTGMVAVASLAQTSKVAIDNDQVKALIVDVQPHAKTKLHEHKVNRVMVYLQPGRQTIDYQDGKRITLDWKAGEPKWSPAAGMHIADIVSDNPVTIVEIELKKPGKPGVSASGPLDPVKIDPKHYHVEFENDQVRVVRVHIPARESTPLHTHALNRVVTYLSDQDFQVTTDGKPEQARHKAGEASWGPPVTHKEENLSDRPFEAVVTELKD